MNKFKFIVLGAGPSGLSFACRLLELGVHGSDILVIEKEDVPGGLCRSVSVDGHPIDIGGGHFLDTRRQEVLDFVFKFMPESEWNFFNRVSKLTFRGEEIDYPLEANIWQLSADVQAKVIDSISSSPCVRGDPMPSGFRDYISWKFGDIVADGYMLPYNRKIWSMDLNEIGTYWLEKLPNVSLDEIHKSCILRSPQGGIPAHSSFYYPKNFGFGELWVRMANKLGNSLVTGAEVTHLNINGLTVNGRWCADILVNTIPWDSWVNFCSLPTIIIEAINELKYTSIDVDYYGHAFSSSAHWIYEADESVAHHRTLIRQNFIDGASGYWTETNRLRSRLSFEGAQRFRNKYGYPVNTLTKPESIKKILKWAEDNNIYGLGRWGQWIHVNSDVAVQNAVHLANDLVT